MRCRLARGRKFLVGRKAVVAAVAVLAGLVVSGCADDPQWREMRPPEFASLTLAFPCRPARSARRVELAAQPVELTLLSCQVPDVTFAASTALIDDPGRVGAMLQALSRATAANVGAELPSPRVIHIPGMTPNDHSAYHEILGRRPDGAALRVQSAVFARGTRVYQLIRLGAPDKLQVQDAWWATPRFAP